MRRLHFFLSESTWSQEEVDARRLELVPADPATAPHPGGVLVIDDSGDRKDGTATLVVVGAAFVVAVGRRERARSCLHAGKAFPTGTRRTDLRHHLGPTDGCRAGSCGARRTAGGTSTWGSTATTPSSTAVAPPASIASDRRQEGRTPFDLSARTVHLRVLVDRTSVEKFGDDSRYAHSTVVFPDVSDTELTLFTIDRQAVFRNMVIREFAV
ncbi:Glycosyl hydrolases family 32 C terminal [Streptomyces sp. cf124]|nr:Glycosyl hydrolases family 32 C terminal [Streptomyces sp. cf124]